jgi:ABC-type glycerol-3-phosphate transport system substrate-binding protein
VWTRSQSINIHVEFSKPEADAATELSVMISAGDMPDSIMMDRGVDNRRLADLGLLVPLEPLMEAHDNFEDNVLPTTIDMLEINGVLYGIPNWSRKAASGGNDAWIYNRRIFEDAGSPKLNTFEDLYNFAVSIRDNQRNNREGLSVTPVQFNATGDAWQVGRAFYRSFGGVQDGWFTVLNGDYSLIFRDQVFRDAVMEANRWWRERLFSETQFTDTGEMILERIVAGRTGILFYDQSADETNHFRRILMETFPDDSYEMVAPFPFPPARGLSTDDIYADHQSTVGWNVTSITTSAEKPQRIFDLWSYLLTPEAAILQMYGPQGDYWETLNEDGFPILKYPEADMTTAEKERLGLWFWMIPGQSDNVDRTKFGVNAMQPPDRRNWVATNQSEVLTPIMWLTDEFVGIWDVIDPLGTEGVNRTLIMEYIAANFPLVIMAPTAAEAERIFNEILQFADDNGMAAIEELKNQKYQENVELVGSGIR